VHTYPAKRFVFMDIFSCKPFDTVLARDYIINYFKSRRPVAHLKERGLDFPRHA